MFVLTCRGQQTPWGGRGAMGWQQTPWLLGDEQGGVQDASETPCKHKWRGCRSSKLGDRRFDLAALNFLEGCFSTASDLRTVRWSPGLIASLLMIIGILIVNFLLAQRYQVLSQNTHSSDGHPGQMCFGPSETLRTYSCRARSCSTQGRLKI